tara:strand:+ start:299 stop:598 length:300 start_codon:yes stop_codon:yes gene_type:complete
MAGNDHNDAYDGGMTVNWSSAIGVSNYTVVCSGHMQFGGSTYADYPYSRAETLELVLLHAYNINSGNFKLQGWGQVGNTGDSSVGHVFYDDIHFAAFDT